MIPLYSLAICAHSIPHSVLRFFFLFSTVNLFSKKFDPKYIVLILHSVTEAKVIYVTGRFRIKYLVSLH